MPDFKGSVSSKLPRVGTTIFTLMSRLSKQHNAINLSQGFPGFSIDQKLGDLVQKAIKSGHNQYAPMAGLQVLREQIALKTQNLYGTSYDVDEEITVTAGATQAIFTAISALVQEGDEVIVFTPAYDCYEPAITLNGGKTLCIALKAPDYRINWDEVKKLINRKTRMIVINSPHNPTGTCLNARDISELEKITQSSEIIILSDEVYEHIIFDGKKHESCAASTSLAARSMVVSSFGKTFHATGWKMGYVVGPARLMAEFRKVHQFNVFSCNTPVQHALAEYLSDPSNYLKLPSFYQQKRDLFIALLKDSRFRIQPAEGTYFQLLDYSEISPEKDVDVAMEWTKSVGVASIPISVFYQNPRFECMLRFCFAKEEDELVDACRILSKL